VLLVALVSPLHAVAEALFSAHMVQHLLLVLVAAPLLVISEPLRVMPWALRPEQRSTLLRWHRRMGAADSPAWTAAALAAHVGVLWLWHLPQLYETAVNDPLIHLAEHATMLGSALLFWWAVAGDVRRQRAGVGVPVLFLATLQGGALGALMAFSPVAWYRVYAESVGAWGLTPLQDQQAAGMLMWMPGGIVYVLAGAALFVSWLRADEHAAAAQSRRARRLPPAAASKGGR
ncbi:MAG TPA: cytochrome c oxidase assembly protein, partial [Egibacteraceae bacterium]|nr:cytochrome c oxidase assembly protein [Egibacteraceae bacterium]